MPYCATFQLDDDTHNILSALSNAVIKSILFAADIFNTGLTAQFTPPPPLSYTRVYSGLYPGIIWNDTLGYSLVAPRLYPRVYSGSLQKLATCPDYTPSDSGWGIVWEIIYYICMITINYTFNIEKLSRTIIKLRIEKYMYTNHKQNILKELLTLWVLDGLEYYISRLLIVWGSRLSKSNFNLMMSRVPHTSLINLLGARLS